jgi:predicted dinucleotide-binding enzyme
MSKPDVRTIGILGAGKVGIVLAQLARAAGYNVNIAGSQEANKISLTISVLVPGAVAMTSEEVAKRSDLIIAAIPLGKYRELPVAELSGKIVIDAMNYWWEVDGERSDLTSPEISSSDVVQKFLNTSNVVKAFNHVGYHDLYDGTRPTGADDRKAIAIAGDTKEDIAIVSKIVNDFGFDPVYIGALSRGRLLQPGGSVFGAHVDSKVLKHMLGVV